MTGEGAKSIFILSSIHHVLKAEKVLEKKGIPFELVPVPKEVNPDCGLAVETDPERVGELAATLGENGLIIEAVYRRIGKDFRRVDSTDH